MLALSLIVESPKSTEKFTSEDFNFILHFLRYNINTQSPNFRQQTLSFFKKVIFVISSYTFLFPLLHSIYLKIPTRWTYHCYRDSCIIESIFQFMRRVEDSYKTLHRENKNNITMKIEHYGSFLRRLREICFDSLLPGTNYSRRCVALQILVWSEEVNLDGWERWDISYDDGISVWSLWNYLVPSGWRLV